MRLPTPETRPLPDISPPSAYRDFLVRLSLGPGLHMCECDGICIFLDIPGDRYFCLSPEQSALFRKIAFADMTDPPTDRMLGFREALIRHRVLMFPGEARPLLPPARTARAPGALRDLRASVPPAMTSVLAARVAHAALTTWWLEKRHRFEGVIAHMEQLKEKPPQGPRNTTPDWETLVAAFHDISPWLFTREDACRFRSIVLIRFLAGYGIAADWVFGVRLAPFGAHCWVEKGETVLNDQADRVREFTPILRV